MGVGTQLIKHLEKVISNMNGKELWVYSERARGFYERKGFIFVQRGYIEDCWQDFLYKSI
jgi:N-acetylglutamate synthase-like GNAT family acetyltransferase